jgi:hypothetical protein
MSTLLENIATYLNQDASHRLVVCTPGRRNWTTYKAADLPRMKPEGDGIRVGKVFLFACQLKFARLTKEN